MKSYGLLERTVAKSLETFPSLRYFAKPVYHRLNYLYFAEQGFQMTLHRQVQLQTPTQWAGVGPESEELFFGYYDKPPWSLAEVILGGVFSQFRKTLSSSSIYDR